MAYVKKDFTLTGNTDNLNNIITQFYDFCQEEDAKEYVDKLGIMVEKTTGDNEYLVLTIKNAEDIKLVELDRSPTGSNTQRTTLYRANGTINTSETHKAAESQVKSLIFSDYGIWLLAVGNVTAVPVESFGITTDNAGHVFAVIVNSNGNSRNFNLGHPDFNNTTTQFFSTAKPSILSGEYATSMVPLVIDTAANRYSENVYLTLNTAFITSGFAYVKTGDDKLWVDVGDGRLFRID